MAKTQPQSTGRISTDLGDSKKVLDRQAKKLKVSAHKLSRDLIIEGLRQIESGELNYQPPSEGGFQR